MFFGVEVDSRNICLSHTYVISRRLIVGTLTLEGILAPLADDVFTRYTYADLVSDSNLSSHIFLT